MTKKINDENYNFWMIGYYERDESFPKMRWGDYFFIKKNILQHRFVEDRINAIKQRFEVKLCYIPNYNGIGNFTYMPRLNEIRIIIGRPKNHEPRQVYCVIIKNK